MKRLLPGILLSLSMSVTPAVAKDVLRIGTEGAFAPFNFINDAGEIDGLERELGDALCERTGFECVWVQNGWDTIIPNLVSGNFDAIMAGMAITEERDAIIDFSEVYIRPSPSAYIVRTGDEVGGTEVAAQSNTIQSAFISETATDLVEFSTLDDAIGALRGGTVSAVFGGKSALTPIVEASNGELTFAGEDIYLGNGVGVGLRKSDVELRKKINTGLSDMKKDGSLNELLKKWLDDNAVLFSE